jgi:hypothetical protein
MRNPLPRWGAPVAGHRSTWRVAAAVGVLLLAWGPPIRAAEPGRPALPQGLGAFAEFDCVQSLPTAPGHPARFTMGDSNGLLHVYEARGAGYAEIWASRYLEGAVMALHVADVNDDGVQEIVVATDRGRVHLFAVEGFASLWSNVPGEYAGLSAATVANVDDDPQPELILCAGGRLVIFDAKDQFEEWRSEQTGLAASDILVADVDGDDQQELVLSDGYVFDARLHSLEWQSPEGFGDRLGALDLDGDNILELIGEFNGRYLKVFDVDLRRAKSLKP